MDFFLSQRWTIQVIKIFKNFIFIQICYDIPAVFWLWKPKTSTYIALFYQFTHSTKC